MDFDWKDLRNTVAKSAPVLGSLIGGPAGGAIGGLIALGLGVDATPDAVAKELAANPEAAIKLAQIEKERTVELQQLLVTSAQNELLADTARQHSVNETMRAEAASDNWPTYSWRPFVGFIFGLTFFCVYVVLPLAKVPVPTIPVEAWMAIGAILGVASWYRGKMQADPRIPTDNRG